MSPSLFVRIVSGTSEAYIIFTVQVIFYLHTCLQDMRLLLLLSVFGMAASLESKSLLFCPVWVEKINFSPSIEIKPYIVIEYNEQIIHVKSRSN